MNSWRNFIDKVKRYFPLDGFEKRGLIITILVLSFIFSFREWGTEKFDFLFGLKNLAVTLILVSIAFCVHEIAHRTVAVWLGYRSQYKAWPIGLAICLVIAFVSNGNILFLAPGSLVITFLPVHRLGKAFYALSYKILGWIAMSGAIANMLFAILLKSLTLITGMQVFHKLMMINIWIALFDLIPIPPFNGCRTFFGSRYVYVFVLGSLIGCAGLLAYVSGFLALIGSLALGVIVLAVFFAHIDKSW